MALCSYASWGWGGGQRGGWRRAEGKYQSSVDACEPQDPTKSEQYQKYLRDELYSTRGARTSKTRCSQRCERPGFPGASSVCTYGFLGLIQDIGATRPPARKGRVIFFRVPYEASAYTLWGRGGLDPGRTCTMAASSASSTVWGAAAPSAPPAPSRLP
eukprot:1177597-Prorocentrum_minimum.AAC.13